MKNVFENKKILIASDHGGFELKEKIIAKYPELEFEDLGPNNTDSVDYPDYAHDLTEKLSGGCGVLICGSGQGMSMTANKKINIRAALCWNIEVSKLSRLHNNANVLCLGARVTEHNLCFEIFETFLSTKFEGGRHINRINKIGKE